LTHAVVYFIFLTIISDVVVSVGCEDCQTSYVSECTKHVLQPISDKVILSRAWASLPLVLQIFRLTDTDNVQNAGRMSPSLLTYSFLLILSAIYHSHVYHRSAWKKQQQGVRQNSASDASYGRKPTHWTDK